LLDVHNVVLLLLSDVLTLLRRCCRLHRCSSPRCRLCYYCPDVAHPH